jgi:hypothetical protein
VYARTVADRCLTFGVSGKLLRNGMLMYDHQTDSLWSQVSGEAVSGPMAGTKLVSLPAVHTTWQAWSGEHPHALVVSKEASPYGYYTEDHMVEYYYSERTGLRPPLHKDKSIRSKETVLGLVVDGRAAAYPYYILRSVKVLQDTVEQIPLVIFYDENSDKARVFLNAVSNIPLSFFVQDGFFKDRQTLSSWSGLTGRASAGALCGQKLQPLPYSNCFWFAWKDHYPKTLVYRLPEPH